MFENLHQAPDRTLALARYRALAPGYNATCRPVEGLRRNALDLLALKEGHVVFDVACGTGAMLPALARRVGSRGAVVGIEQSPEMLAIARDRARRESAGGNVTLIEAPVQQLRCERTADALLFFYTHDVLQSPAALMRLFAHARPGARVVAAGARFLPWWWGAPLNLWTAVRARRYLTTYHGLSRPWRVLERFVPDFALVGSNFLGTAYLGSGTYDEAGCKVLAADRAMERMA